MKIIDLLSTRPRPTIATGDIPVGTVFRAHLAGGITHIFLRIHTGIVALDDPARTWTMNPFPDFWEYTPLNVELHVIGELP